MQISAFNNPQRPLENGWAVSLPGVLTKRRVHYDDCREADGTMIEAKGPGFAKMLSSGYMRERLRDRWEWQGARQQASALGRGLEWYFAEPEAASYAADVFNTERTNRISIIVQRAFSR